MVASPSLSDLRYNFYGGGSAAEYAFLQSAFAAGISAQNIINLGYNGNGTPEGVIFAPVGSSYTDNLTGKKYSKSTAIGLNTGWLELSQVINTLLLDMSLLQLEGEDATHVLTGPRGSGMTNLALLTGQLYLSYFTALKRLSVTKIGCVTGVASTTPTLVRFGLFTVAADESVALVAATDNDTTLLALANTPYEKALGAGGAGLPLSYDLINGNRYAVGLLVVGGAPGSISGFQTNNGWSNTIFGRRMGGIQAGLADLPAAITSGNVAVDAKRMLFSLFGIPPN